MNSGNRRAYLALAALCIIWGTTFLATRVGVKAFPSLLFMGTRHSLAGLLLIVFCTIRNKALPRWSQLQQQLLPGIMLVTLGNGIVSVAVRTIPSGLAALICAMIPVFAVIINLFVNRTEPLNYKIVSGLLLGVAGLTVIFKDNLLFLANKQYLGGIVICLVSCVFWAMGSIYTKHKKGSDDVLLNVGCQLFIGGLGLLLGSVVLEDWKSVHSMPSATISALVYLVLFGSITAFICFNYAISKLPIGLASIYAYINPLVAIILGFLVLGETITGYTVLAFLLTIAGIFLINAGYRHKPVEKKNKINPQLNPA